MNEFDISMTYTIKRGLAWLWVYADRCPVIVITDEGHFAPCPLGVGRVSSGLGLLHWQSMLGAGPWSAASSDNCLGPTVPLLSLVNDAALGVLADNRSMG